MATQTICPTGEQANIQQVFAGATTDLDTLVENAPYESVVNVAIDSLAPDPGQPRRNFATESLARLAQSMEAHGLLEPIVVRPMAGPKKRGKFWIVAGMRRWQAARALGWTHIPVLVRPYSGLQARVNGLVENVHREDLTDMEKSDALTELKRTTDKTWPEIADLVKLSLSRVQALAGLQGLAEPVQEMVREGRIPGRTAIVLRPLPQEQQQEFADRVIHEGMTAEQIRAEVRPEAPVDATPRNRVTLQPVVIEEPRRGRNVVINQLVQFGSHIETLTEWVSRRDWNPVQMSPGQRDAFEGFFQRVTRLQQEMLRVRTRIREAQATEEPVATGQGNAWPF